MLTCSCFKRCPLFSIQYSSCGSCSWHALLLRFTVRVQLPWRASCCHDLQTCGTMNSCSRCGSRLKMCARSCKGRRCKSKACSTATGARGVAQQQAPWFSQAAQQLVRPLDDCSSWPVLHSMNGLCMAAHTMHLYADLASKASMHGCSDTRNLC